MADAKSSGNHSLVWDESDSRVSCKYGIDCYRKEEYHFKKFKHPKKISEKDMEIPSKRLRIEEPEDSGYVRPEEDLKTNVGKKCIESKSNTGSSSGDPKHVIKEKFLVDMPEDFYDFWEFCKELEPTNPSVALLKSIDIKLVGPFDVLAGRCKERNSKGESPCYLRHWRYYYDPPEFLTVLRGDDKTQFHVGYFRDDPKELPAFVASNSAASNGTIIPKGENLFAAVKILTDEAVKKEKNAAKKKTLSALSSRLEKYATDKGYSLEAKTKNMKSRDKKVVCKSFHGAGIVVPVDDNEVGYRELPATTGDLKKMFQKIASSKSEDERNKHLEPVENIICLVQFANDECDYGQGLELGMDMFNLWRRSFSLNDLLPSRYGVPSARTTRVWGNFICSPSQ